MKRMVLILSLTLILISLLTSLGFAQEEKKAKPVEQLKIKGQLIAHTNQNEVKVMTDDFQTLTIPLKKGARIDATIRVKLEDITQENETRLPTGEVTYEIIDGKPVATRVSYSSGRVWKIEPPKPEE